MSKGTQYDEFFSHFIAIGLIAAFSVACKKGDESLKETPDRDHLTCAATLDWHELVLKSDHRGRLAGYCKQHLAEWNLGKAASNCLKLPAAKISRSCSSRTFGDRVRAANLQNDAEFVAWSESLAEDIVRSERLTLLAHDEIFVHVVRTVGQRIAQARDTSNFEEPFHFEVFRSDERSLEMNAPALAGGHIFVGAALVQALSESELALVLGHEVAHVEWSSPDQELLETFVSRPLLDRAKALALDLCEGPFDEIQADRFGLRMLFARTIHLLLAPTWSSRVFVPGET